MKLYFFRTDPVQEIAAEPNTLAQLEDILRPKAVEPRAAPELLSAWSAFSLPLVRDESIRPGVIHARPTSAPPDASHETPPAAP
ncbi:hypothetical protein [Streptomyces stelliscabiei]|uniref:Uncharacterized protein n=1 Tax=Streptomyces stelliscabiei TaxID=146820 RepID=A0A8I0TVV0_9ACTN|nr:hypothetical protein [Streptomyces stelliscabiei]KND29876.1 hypothetical protein IQ64_41725 [Streptomyces stelliscabiei]MBE1598980.1 hypothetical protein [Streptomyces stelliscabiei]MBE1599723.1 hypothetical protein [Streptomyces stelliscabiei]MDX2519382.1 hypothetical protein [Streptomyces stelliscabiei]MDX2549688.1 hypothetical protein [Streptomyces stelliscabiei]